jgi:hypothetical protein
MLPSQSQKCNFLVVEFLVHVLAGILQKGLQVYPVWYRSFVRKGQDSKSLVFTGYWFYNSDMNSLVFMVLGIEPRVDSGTQACYIC